MPILGTIASSKFTAVAGDYELISKTTLSSDTTTVTLSSIPQTYKHLMLIVAALNDNSSAYTGVQLRVNGNSTSTNYSEHYLQVNYDTASVSAGGGNNSDWDYFYSAGTFFANRVALNHINIYDYTSTNKQKSFMNTAHFLNNGDSSGVAKGFGGLYTGNYRSTSAITSLEMVHNSSVNWKSGSVFWFYGIRG